MKSYPIQIINSFTAGEISRRQFVQHFSNWQKSNGANFDCKGTTNRDGDFITYRGITARLVNGVLYWKNNIAPNLFTFQRQVDYAINAESQALVNACYYANKAYEASKSYDYKARADFQYKQNFFVKKAEKWAALWN